MAAVSGAECTADKSDAFGGYLPEDTGGDYIAKLLKSCRAALLSNADGEKVNLDGNAWSHRQAESGLKGEVQSASTTAGVTSWKCQITLPYSPAVLKAAISPTNRNKWDTQVRSIEEKLFVPTEVDNVTCAVTIYSVNGVLVIAARDFVDVSYHETTDDGSVLLYGRSIETPMYGPQSGYVRAENLEGGGWVIKPILSKDGGVPTASRCSYVIMSDLKGWLPAWAVD